jgi:NAD(P)H-hydrate repair Nnr-like enzyme with NAD(P)H-hydrate dehydratase domain
LAAARELSRRYHCTVILKGSGTVIAQRDGKIAINTTGNAALATAGTGDILAGICSALLAQGWAERDAALAAPWLHGHAADVLVVQGAGPVGLTASELIPVVRASLNRLINERGRRS